MADTKITDLTELTALALDDVFPVVDDPGGSPITKKATMDTLLDLADPRGIHHRMDTANADDDEFNDASLAGAWTTVTPQNGTCTWTESRGVLSAKFSDQASGDTATVLKSTTLSDGQFYETHIRGLYGSNSNHCKAGVCITDGTTGASNILGAMVYTQQNSLPFVAMWSGTIDAASAIHYGNIGGYGVNFDGIFLRLKRTSSTSFTTHISPDGVTWLEIETDFDVNGTPPANPGFTPTHAGLWVSSHGGTDTYAASFSYFRKIT